MHSLQAENGASTMEKSGDLTLTKKLTSPIIGQMDDKSWRDALSRRQHTYKKLLPRKVLTRSNHEEIDNSNQGTFYETTDPEPSKTVIS